MQGSVIPKKKPEMNAGQTSCLSFSSLVLRRMAKTARDWAYEQNHVRRHDDITPALGGNVHQHEGDDAPVEAEDDHGLPNGGKNDTAERTANDGQAVERVEQQAHEVRDQGGNRTDNQIGAGTITTKHARWQ